MASRSIGHNSIRDWEPMQEDLTNSNYDSQYPDDSSSDFVKLDHCRLYITNIPKALNDEGLRAAFSKFGTLCEVYMNKDPNKRYGLVAFETPAEARHAMMKLDKVEPMKLNISIAHEKRDRKDASQSRNTGRSTSTREAASVNRERPQRYRDDSGSYGRWRANSNRKLEEMANGGNLVPIEDLQVDLEDDLGLEAIDPDLQLELERLHLERLKLQQAQVVCKQRMLLKQVERRAVSQTQPNSRCVLPDGKVILRNVPDSNEVREVEGNFAAGAGDSLKIPGLQRVGSRACVVCGAVADAFCGRCGVTPYCSTRCQRRDWQDRHASVCHNLARLNAPTDVDNPVEVDLNIPPPEPLRRPRSPPPRSPRHIDREDAGSDKSAKKCTPPGHHSVLKSAQGAQRNLQGGRNFNNRNDNQFDKPNKQFDKSNKQSDNDKPNRQSDNDKPNRQFDNSNKQSDNDKPNRQFNNANRQSDHDKPNRQFDKPNRQFDNSNRQSDNDKPNRQFDRPNRQFDNSNRHFDNDKPNRQFDNSNRQSDNDKPNKSDRFRQDRQAQDGRPQFRRPHVANEGQFQRGRQSPGQFGRSFHDRKQFQNRAKFAEPCHSDEENWDASKSEPKPQPKEEPKSVPTRPPVKETPVQANRAEAISAPTNQKPPPANQNEAQSPSANQKPPASASDVTPTRKLVPKNCVVELLSQGDTVVLTVESLAADCHTPGSGFVCVTLNEKYEEDYQSLCDDYSAACEAENTPYTPSPGETFSYLNAEDGAWYRARCLSRSHAALLDSAKVVSLDAARCVRLPPAFARAPEMSAALQADVQLGDGLKGVLLDKTAKGWKVELSHPASGAALGGGELARWLPTVQYPAHTNTAGPAAASIPEVPRPALAAGQAVVLLHVTDARALFVRASGAEVQRAFDAVLHDAAMHGLNAPPLSSPPAAGGVVLSKFSDGLHYRALVKRTNIKQNKYLLEYLEFGNVDVGQLEDLASCPAELQPAARPVLTSRAALLVTSPPALATAATNYLDELKDDTVELMLSIPGGAKSAPSGAEVLLTVSASKESVNKKVEEMCTPEWLKLQRSGGDVLELERIMYSELEFVELPETASELVVTDCSALPCGTVSVTRDLPHLTQLLNTLTQQMRDYCESEIGREPYLPKAEELCIAQLPNSSVWARCVLAEQVPGPGGQLCELHYIDHGNIERAPVAGLRKMLRAFLSDLPALACTAEIADFPASPTAGMLERARAHLHGGGAGRGRLAVSGVERLGPGMYTVHAPALLRAMGVQ